MTVQRNILQMRFCGSHNQHSICPVWHFFSGYGDAYDGGGMPGSRSWAAHIRGFSYYLHRFLWWIMCFLRLSETTMLRPSPWLERWWEVFPMLSLTMCYVPNGDGTGRSSTCHSSLSDRQHINLQYSFFSEEKIRYSLQRPDHRYGCLQHPASWGVPAFVENFLPEWQQRFLITWF